MKFVQTADAGRRGLSVEISVGAWRGWWEGYAGYPGDLRSLIGKGPNAILLAGDALATGGAIISTRSTLPPIANPRKILCVGLNYREHATESNVAVPQFPTIFARFATSLLGHGQPIFRPRISTHLDFEAEMVAVIGTGGRRISRERALDHVAGYSVFNDGSVRDIQLRTSQWTLGKNFDRTGAFGPCFVTADSLPPDGRGLRVTTRLNGAVMQDATTADMIFDVPTLVAELSEAMTLEPGDLIVTGTPTRVGQSRKPPVFMKPGDLREVEIENIGTLRKVAADETA